MISGSLTARIGGESTTITSTASRRSCRIWRKRSRLRRSAGFGGNGPDGITDRFGTIVSRAAQSHARSGWARSVLKPRSFATPKIRCWVGRRRSASINIVTKPPWARATARLAEIGAFAFARIRAGQADRDQLPRGRRKLDIGAQEPDRFGRHTLRVVEHEELGPAGLDSIDCADRGQQRATDELREVECRLDRVVHVVDEDDQPGGEHQAEQDAQHDVHQLARGIGPVRWDGIAEDTNGIARIGDHSADLGLEELDVVLVPDRCRP